MINLTLSSNQTVKTYYPEVALVSSKKIFNKFIELPLNLFRTFCERSYTGRFPAFILPYSQFLAECLPPFLHFPRSSPPCCACRSAREDYRIEDCDPCIR